ncbi:MULTISPECIES: SCO3374 family protein [unclassified Streptomyces]|uniref:SCO3374 family protein n=1 Tax=unclassified Streptomyces TaxID=2593676 RepID=UPI0035DF7C15
MASTVSTVPLPRRPLDAGDPVREWYEKALGWATAPGPKGLQLLTGLRFDVLELPAEAGRAVLRRLDPGCPVARQGGTMRLLVAAGSAEELPGLLDWLEWGALPLDLTAVGAGGRIDAPAPAGVPDAQEAAVWVRPPEPGCDVEPSLPALTALSAVGGGGGAPGLVRLVETAATQCHRIRLRRAGAQPLAFS